MNVDSLTCDSRVSHVDRSEGMLWLNYGFRFDDGGHCRELRHVSKAAVREELKNVEACDCELCESVLRAEKEAKRYA